MLVAFAASIAILTPLVTGKNSEKSEEVPPTTVATTVVTTTEAPVIESTTTSTTTTTTTTLPDLSNVDFVSLARDMWGKCGEWHDLAISVGWPEEEWPTMSMVLYRESRCSTESYYSGDANGGSHGLMQINGFWCRPWSGSKIGWLQENGILTNCDDLYNPEINLRAAWAIWQYGEAHNGCGWRQAWATKCSN